jgi:hypothetical protein
VSEGIVREGFIIQIRYMGSSMRRLPGDIRNSLRLLVRNPGFAMVVVLTLALGMGASTAVFSVADAALLRPLPFPDSDRIVTLWNIYPEEFDTNEPVSPPDFCDWHEQNSSFAFLAAYEQYFYILAANPDAGFQVIFSPPWESIRS